MGDIITEILDGHYDGLLEGIQEAARQRRSTLAQRKLHWEYEVGDIVVFTGLGMGAKYLNGIRARIEEINRKTVWVRIVPEDKGKIAGTRFGRSSRIKVYPQNIEHAFIEGEAQAPLVKLVGGDL